MKSRTVLVPPHTQGARVLRQGELRPDRCGARGVPQAHGRRPFHTDRERVRGAQLLRRVRTRLQPRGKQPTPWGVPHEGRGPVHLVAQQGGTQMNEKKLKDFLN